METSSSQSKQDVGSTGTCTLSYDCQCTQEGKRVIFIAIWSTMVNVHPKQGIFSKLAKQLQFEPLTVLQQWHSMGKSLCTLLINHPDEDDEKIIYENHHILFGTKHNMQQQGKFKHDGEELQGWI